MSAIFVCLKMDVGGCCKGCPGYESGGWFATGGDDKMMEGGKLVCFEDFGS